MLFANEESALESSVNSMKSLLNCAASPHNYGGESCWKYNVSFLIRLQSKITVNISDFTAKRYDLLTLSIVELLILSTSVPTSCYTSLWPRKFA
jgi:hypothetical protein